MIEHGFCGGFWWIFPLVMIVLCFFMVRGRRWPMMFGFGSRWADWDRSWTRDSAKDILDRRYASGEINRSEYEEMRKVLDDEPASAE